MKKLYIPIILGTVRKGRFSEHAARLVYEQLKERDEVETELIDLRSLPFDLSDEGEDQKDKDFAEKCDRADGFVIVSPEYNRSFPGSLKHALDTNYKEYRYKAAGVCGVSSGRAGGARAINALLPTLKIYGMYVIRPEVYFASVQKAFSESGKVEDQDLVGGYEKQMGKFFDELVKVAREMRTLRSNLK